MAFLKTGIEKELLGWLQKNQANPMLIFLICLIKILFYSTLKSVFVLQPIFISKVLKEY
jgi:hypothetical protein